jgi:hypothetical protein
VVSKGLRTLARALSLFQVFRLSKPNAKSRRADSNRLPLLQLRVISQVLQGFALPCKSRISKRLSLLRLAGCCTVLRSRWCQSGVKRRQEFARSLYSKECVYMGFDERSDG